MMVDIIIKWWYRHLCGIGIFFLNRPCAAIAALKKHQYFREWDEADSIVVSCLFFLPGLHLLLTGKSRPAGTGLYLT